MTDWIKRVLSALGKSTQIFPDNLPVIIHSAQLSPGGWAETILEQPLKKTKKNCDEVLPRFGDGEYLKHICTGKGVYPDQATFWRCRQKDPNLTKQFMGSLIKNVSALLEKSELLIEEAVTRDLILKADKMLNHYRWKAEKPIPSVQSTNKALVKVQGAVESYTVSWAEDAVTKSQKPAQNYLKLLPKRGENERRKTGSLANTVLMLVSGAMGSYDSLAKPHISKKTT